MQISAPHRDRATRAAWPAGEGVRVDTHIGTGGEVPPVLRFPHGQADRARCQTREQAVERLGKALASLHIEGLPTTAPLHRRIVADPRFIAGGVDTGFLATDLPNDRRSVLSM